MKRGGRAYIAVPVGVENIEFNAHRIFNPNTVIKAFDKMKLLEFSVTSSCPTESIVKNADPDAIAKQDNYAASVEGLFEFEKL